MAQGMKNTVLDHLPAGTDADLAKGKIPHTLPDGVTNRAVYQDILQIALPASVELILSSFTSMADLIMVGNLGPTRKTERCTPFRDVYTPTIRPCSRPGGRSTS